jgi:hypothetical protein
VNEDIIIPIAGMITGVVMLLGFPLIVVHARRLWVRDSAKQQEFSPDVDHRLDRIEQAIDAMAVEVERISEGQRFMTRLLSDRQEKAAIPAGQRHHEA